MEWYLRLGFAWLCLGTFTSIWFGALLVTWKRKGGRTYKPRALMGFFLFGFILWPVTLFLLVTSLLERPRQ